MFLMISPTSEKWFGGPTTYLITGILQCLSLDIFIFVVRACPCAPYVYIRIQHVSYTIDIMGYVSINAHGGAGGFLLTCQWLCYP